MIDKRILWWVGGGAVAASIVIAVTVNVVINNNTAGHKHLSCIELQQAIDDIGRPGFDLLPERIVDSARKQDGNCNVIGKDWLIVNGRLQRQMSGTKWQQITDDGSTTVIGDERSILDDFK